MQRRGGYVPEPRKYIELNTLMTRIRERIVERGALGVKGIGRLFRIADDEDARRVEVFEIPRKLQTRPHHAIG